MLTPIGSVPDTARTSSSLHDLTITNQNKNKTTGTRGEMCVPGFTTTL